MSPAQFQDELRRAEASAFDAATLALVIDLINAKHADELPHAQWIRAVEAANTAERSVTTAPEN